MGFLFQAKYVQYLHYIYRARKYANVPANCNPAILIPWELIQFTRFSNCCPRTIAYLCLYVNCVCPTREWNQLDMCSQSVNKSIDSRNVYNKGKL